MTNRDLVITEVSELITVDGECGVYGTYHFGDVNGIQESSQIVREFLQCIICDRQRFVRLAVSKHIRRNDAVTCLNPWANLVPPAIPVHSLVRGLGTISTSTYHTRGRESRVPRAG